MGLGRLSWYGAEPALVADRIGIRCRTRARLTSAGATLSLAAALLLIGSITLLACAPSALSRGAGVGPVSTCEAAEWPPTVIPCEAAFRIGNQAGARVDQARIWLTTLGPVIESMGRIPHDSALSDTTEVWLIAYDGRWVCCPRAFDENGEQIPQVDHRRWLVAAEAAREGAGFVFIQDWTGEPIPDSLPRPPG